jgi:hypothetical protein
MKTMPYTETYNVYSSEVWPDVQTRDEHLAEIIRWADAVCPVAWKIVTTKKSKAFGMGSSTYIGYAQNGTTSASILERLKVFYHELHRKPKDTTYPIDFFVWKANYTLEHYNDKKLTGGLFQQWDGTYDRGCSVLDYTPDTLPLVIERFVAWCGNTFETKAVKIDKKIVWTPESGILLP